AVRKLGGRRRDVYSAGEGVDRVVDAGSGEPAERWRRSRRVGAPWQGERDYSAGRRTGTQSFDGNTDMVVDTTIVDVDQNGKDSAVLPVVDLEPETSKQGRRQQNRKGRAKGGVKRTRSVLAVVEDAKEILGENLEV
ncbi:Os02g0709900, partial [Oryza sativa Japonica Group]